MSDVRLYNILYNFINILLLQLRSILCDGDFFRGRRVFGGIPTHLLPMLESLCSTRGSILFSTPCQLWYLPSESHLPDNVDDSKGGLRPLTGEHVEPVLSTWKFSCNIERMRTTLEMGHSFGAFSEEDGGKLVAWICTMKYVYVLYISWFTYVVHVTCRPLRIFDGHVKYVGKP